MDLSKNMTIQVSTVTVTGPVAGARPGDLPEGSDWPPPDGKRVIYRVGSSSEAVCSDCITDPARVTDVQATAREGYGYRSLDLIQVPRADNGGWYCTVPAHDGGTYNRNTQGSRLI